MECCSLASLSPNFSRCRLKNASQEALGNIKKGTIDYLEDVNFLPVALASKDNHGFVDN